jgi:OOP family OmpA-OmpF porin
MFNTEGKIMKKIAIVALLSTLAAAPAMAADTGFYAGVNVGSATINSPGLSSTTAIGVLGGYDFNKNFAAELAYTDFGSKSYPGFSVKSSAVSLSGVGSYPINEQFSVFAKLGVASTSMSATGSPTTSKSDLTYGVGAQLNVNKQIGIRLGYDVYKVSDGVVNRNENVWGVGAVFKF